jgi:Domain of unknown function (DUF6316)
VIATPIVTALSERLQLTGGFDMNQERNQQGIFPFRKSSRIWHCSQGWFFDHREGCCGPFQSQAEAENELILFVRGLTQADCFGRETEHFYAISA